MKEKQKLTSLEQEQISQTHAQPTTAREFSTAEELIHHDASQIEVPPTVAARLNESIQREPKTARPWWRRITGR